MLTCRSCGQHFFEKYYQELEFAKGPKNQLRGFEHGNATQDDDGKDNAVWSTAPAENGTRLVLTNRLLEEADGGPTTKSTRWPRALVLPPVRGDAPGASGPLPGRWLRPQGTAAAADGLRPSAFGLSVVQFAVATGSAAGRSNRPARCRRSRFPTFTFWPRR